MKEDEQNTLAIIDNYNFYDTHTYTWTWRLYDRLAQSAESEEKNAIKAKYWLPTCIGQWH